MLGVQVREAALSLPADLPAADAVAAVERELGALGPLLCGVPLPEPALFVGREPQDWLPRDHG